MGQALSRMRPIALKERVEGVTESHYAEEYRIILASVYPLTSSTAAQIYGEKVHSMKLLLAPNGIEIKEAMGVCVDVPRSAQPDYRVVGVPEKWSMHIRAHLEFIPESQRGDAG